MARLSYPEHDEASLRVVYSYLRLVEAADEATKTKAVEALIRRLLSGPLSKYKGKVYAVGGFVRDELLGLNPKDLDLVVESLDPEGPKAMDAAKEFSEDLVRVLGIKSENQPQVLNVKFGIYGVALFLRDSEGNRIPFLVNSSGEIVSEGGIDVSGYVIEMTPPREEGPYRAGSREPEYVRYTDIATDQRRRDLTINALYKDVSTGKIVDHVGGKEDLKDKVLRPPKPLDTETVEESGGKRKRVIADIYREDPLRILRIIRFGGKLPGFRIDDGTKDTIRKFVEDNKKFVEDKLSKERIQSEFFKILTGSDPVSGMEAIRDFGLLELISSELNKMLTALHDTVHHQGESVWDHTMQVLSKSPATLKARLSALFHDIGKIGQREDPKTGEMVPIMSEKVDAEGRKRVQFIGHEDASAKMIDKILRDLKVPNDVIKSVRDMAHSHMGFKQFWTSKNKEQLKKMRIFIERLHKDLDDAIALLKADENVKGDKTVKDIEDLIHKLKEDDIAAGLLKDRGGKLEYVLPASVNALKQEFNLDNKLLGVILKKLKEIMFEGRIKNEEDVRKELSIIMKDKAQIKSLLDKADKKSDSFYTVRS